MTASQLVRLPPKGILAIRQYRKAVVNFHISGRPHKGLPFGRLEPCDGKLSSTVLRGLGAGNSPRLPGARENMTSNENEIDVVFFAAYNGEIETIEKFLANGISPNIQNEGGKSLLHVACDDGYFGLLELLLQNGADPNIEDKDGDTPFDYAVFRNHKEFQEMLIAHGAIIRNRQSSVER
ncbi:MAG: ankyrin repeat domain-containing protein, partial [Candidatus Roizmanbacteria bacterium]|nr:ankyrin repeat domain-containing protein [Candidatus Roizmanbacteria bacterium]